MNEHKRRLEQAKAVEEVRVGMAQLREAITAEMPWLSADEVNEAVEKELVTAAPEMDEDEAQQ